MADAAEKASDEQYGSAEDGYEFTQDWFHWAPALLTELVPQLPGRKEFLEIGSFEGRSTVWLVENMLEDGGTITCVDTWEGGEEHGFSVMENAEERFDRNMARLAERFPARDLVKFKSPSLGAMISLADNNYLHDFIYIDGSHTAPDVLTDAILAWPLLKKGGIIVFDDYLWGDPRNILHRPKLAIDSFINIFAEQLEVLHLGYQCALRKRP